MSACTLDGDWVLSQSGGTLDNPCLGLSPEGNSDVVGVIRRFHEYPTPVVDEHDVEVLLLLTPH